MLTYVNTALFTLKHSFMFQPSSDHLQRVLKHFKSRVNKILVQVYQIRPHRIIRYMTAENANVSYNILLPRKVQCATPT
jgi:hypothetical protein